ncbi:TadE/TadG family type IV pilus assembly protein [Streptomyces jumonjinensis]|nr:TadE/TadG family type IV pilus assembly protein [Streptomyces jumonjinensis]
MRPVPAGAGASGARVLGRMRAVYRLDDRGQAAVEFAGTLPVILVTLALLWQAALIGYTFSLAGNAADAGARAGAVAGVAACGAAAREDLPDAWQSADIDCQDDGDLFRVSVDLPVPILFPGAVNFPFEVPADAAAPMEDPS